MKDRSNRARSARRLLAAATLFAAASLCLGQSQPEQLDPYITSATRTPARPETVGTAVDFISGSELARQQITSVTGALAAMPGASTAVSGAPGSTTSVFMRGANSNQILFLVDGIRMNDPNTDYQAALGGLAVDRGEIIEIARGPQSTLYGAEAIGGVVSLSRLRGSGAPTSNASLEAGSFGTVNGMVGCQGAQGANAWNFSARAAHTDNDRPNNRFDSANVGLRLDRQLNPTTAVGGTLRWYRGELGSPGDRFTQDPNDQETENNTLATAFADLRLSDVWTAHAVLGGQERRYVADTPAPNAWDGPSAKTIVTNRRGVLDGQTSFTGWERNRLTAGGTAEATHTRNTGFGAINNKETLWAVFAQDEVTLTDTVFVTAGIRHDSFDTFGEATTGRGTLAWLPVPHTLKLRASYGTGFREPSFLDLYGRDAYYVGNASLRPERERGVDAGVDYYLPGHAGTLSATWFQSNFTNLIENDFFVFPSTVRNVGRARTQGVEFSARTRLADAVEATLSYTYLDAQSLLPRGHDRLKRRPRHSFYADAHREFAGGVTAGAAVQFVSNRIDVDAQTFTAIQAEDYTVVRVYAAWQATPRLTVKARVENALDEKYEPVNGYPALGVGAFAGVDWRF